MVKIERKKGLKKREKKGENEEGWRKRQGSRRVKESDRVNGKTGE